VKACRSVLATCHSGRACSLRLPRTSQLSARQAAATFAKASAKDGRMSLRTYASSLDPATTIKRSSNTACVHTS